MIPRLGLVRSAGVIALALAVAGTIYAYTGANSTPASKAGDGTGSIQGYTLSSVAYNLNATSPQNLDSVTLTLSAAPTAGSTIKLGLAGSSGSTTWYACTNSSTTVTCTTTSPQATAWGVTNGGTASSCPCHTSATGTLTLVVTD